MALVTSVQSMNNRTTNTAGCSGTLQLLHRARKLTMVAHETVSIWVGIWEFQSNLLALRLLHHRDVLTQGVLCGSCPSPALSESQQALFKCHGDVIHLLGLNMDWGSMQGSGFGCSYYNVIAGFQPDDKGLLSLPLHVSWVRLASEFRCSGWEAPLSPQGGREATNGMLLPSLTL